MKSSAKKTASPGLALRRALRSLHGERAPESLLPAVLARVGLGDRYWRLDSPLGTVYVAHSPAGISMVSRAGSAAAFERRYRERFGRPVSKEKSAAPAEVRALIHDPKSGERGKLRFDLRSLSEFERAVLLKALEIPGGEVRPYSWIAREIGHPDAVRAAGSALAHNPVPLLIPCHRVVRADGHIGNYSMGGRSAKRRLLRVEGADPAVLESLAAKGVRYLGSEEGRYFCFPTCGGLHHLVLANRVPFASPREAIAAGYAPCGDCRPLAA